MNWTSYLSQNSSTILRDLGIHVVLALIPLALGFVLALPLGYWARRFGKAYTPLMATSSILYSIPSLALFVLLPGILGIPIISPLNIIIGLTLYTAALLVRTVADGLASVPEHVNQAATAVGYRRLRRLTRVELPIAVPVIISGLRVASVTNISLVSVGALIGIGGLGQLFTDGFQRDFLTPIIVGIVLIILLSILADTVLVLIQRVLTPWAKAEASR
ncbi:MAG: ABC transporter permease [Sciscionella sp.]